jgi:MFS family permease
VVYAQTYSTFPLWVRDLGFDEALYGFLQGANGFLVVAFELAVTAIALRHVRTRMIALGILLTGLGFGAFAFLRSAPGMFAAVAIWSFGEMFDSPSVAAFAADRAPQHVRGRYQSALGVTYGLAFTVGPVVGTALYQVRAETVWYGCAALGVLGAALALAAERRPAPAV